MADSDLAYGLCAKAYYATDNWLRDDAATRWVASATIDGMRRLAAAIALAFAAVLATAAPALAGSAHFVGTPSYTLSGATITVTAKEAGLGDLAQIHVVLSGTVACVNPGGNAPSAANKASFSVASDEPVQNGKSDYSLSVTPVFQPSCSPPMTVAVVSLILEDPANGLTATPVPAG
jgi:hypothetical protein